MINFFFFFFSLQNSHCYEDQLVSYHGCDPSHANGNRRDRLHTLTRKFWMKELRVQGHDIVSAWSEGVENMRRKSRLGSWKFPDGGKGRGNWVLDFREKLILFKLGWQISWVWSRSECYR